MWEVTANMSYVGCFTLCHSEHGLTVCLDISRLKLSFLIIKYACKVRIASFINCYIGYLKSQLAH